MIVFRETEHKTNGVRSEEPMAPQKNQTLIVGVGEIGRSLYNILVPIYPTWGVDIRPELNGLGGKAVPSKVDVMHICIRYTPDFLETVGDYVKRYQPEIIDVCSTVPPGTCEQLGDNVCHSTTRGLHPNLETGLKTITKHIGGGKAQALAGYFERAGIPTHTHEKARTTELLHILNNAHYGVNLMFADEAAKLCRDYGVDYFDWMLYGHTNNVGYEALGNGTKVRPILTPPGGKIGGHCVTMSAGLIPPEKQAALMKMLADYNGQI